MNVKTTDAVQVADKHDDKPKATDIVVNGRQRAVAGKELSFEQLIALAFTDVPTGPNVLFSVTYRRGSGNKPEGTLTAGESIKLKEGMIFSVTATDKS